MNHRRKLDVLAVSFALAVAGCGGASSDGGADPGRGTGAAKGERVRDGGTLAVATLQPWTGFNPHTPDQGSSIGLAIGNLVFPSPFVVRPDLTVELNRALFKRAELTREKPQTVVYELRPDAKWSDGRPISADDFVYLWRHLSGSVPNAAVSSTLGYDDIRSVRGSDGRRTVTVVFRRPFGEWQSLFNALLPSHFMRTLGEDAKAWNEGLATRVPPTAGPFVIAKNRPNQSLEFKRNAAWPGTAPHLDGFTLQYVKDTQAVIQALTNGELDLAPNVSADRATIAQLKGIPSASTSFVPTTSLHFLGFQFGHPQTAAVEVRRAIAAAIDIEEMATKLYGAEAVSDKLLASHHVFAPGSPDYRSSDWHGLGKGDVARAAQILEQAGFARDEQGVFSKDGRRLSLTYAVAGGDPVDEQVAVLIQAALKQAGIEVKIVTTPDSAYFKQVLIPGDYDMLSFTYPGSAFPVSWSEALYTCKGGYNFQRYCDKGVDRAFARASATLDARRRVMAVTEIDAKLWDDLELVPLWTDPYVAVARDSVAGFKPNPVYEWTLRDTPSWGSAQG